MIGILIGIALTVYIVGATLYQLPPEDPEIVEARTRFGTGINP